jgi:hypothetical protein
MPRITWRTRPRSPPGWTIVSVTPASVARRITVSTLAPSAVQRASIAVTVAITSSSAPAASSAGVSGSTTDAAAG